MKRFSYYLMLGLIIQATLITPVSISHAQENELDSLFDDEFESDMGAPIPPPPPPPGDQGFDSPPPPPPQDSFTPPPPPSGGGFAPSSRPVPKVTGVPAKPAGPGKGKSSIAHAGIEDITNENFPDLIDSFDYPNADIADIVKAISELTGKNFIIDPGVRGKITIVAPTQITVAEAYKAFLSALAMNNFTIVPSGKFLKIVPVRTAARSNIETYSGAYYPDADVMITRIAKLKHISAEEVNKNLRFLPTKDGEMNAYAPTNSLIITDYGSNIDRIMKILRELDQPGFEEQLAVIPVRFAKAKEIADLIMQIINKEAKGAGGAQGGFNAGVPRFRPPSARAGTPEEYSMVAPDERTNAIIVLGNKTGIQKVRELIRKLDYKLDPSETGGVFVYYVRYGEAEKLSTVFTGIAQGSGAPGAGGASSPGGRPFVSPTESRQVFTNDVKVTPDKQNNSLVITASRQDYQVVLSILRKLDIPRDQVFVEAYIVEMQSSRVRDWQVNYVRYADNGSGGAGLKSGFIGSSGSTLQGLLSPTGGQGAILGFGVGDYLDLKVGGETVRIPSILSLVNILVTQNAGNILSTPQILALDNEDAEIEVGEKIAVSRDSTPTSTGAPAVKTTFDDATIKLTITPFISPDTDDVQMKLTQSVKQPSTSQSQASGLANDTVNLTTRSIKTNIVVASGNTAVLGGLMQDQETSQEAKVPILGDIPVLGWLFKSSKTVKNKINLTMFLTPKIIRSGSDHQRLVNRKKAQRIEWVKKNQGGRDPFAEVVDQLPSRAGSDVIRDPASARKLKKNRRAKN